ncbi:MAG TPA: hypothetical protein PLJ21_09690, partial [Pseudobdellovibrionaceae bacterium]|nr:hypothetical protein [Pseudobdellovibrionaceae bacterium]
MSIQSRVLQIKDLELLLSYDEKKRKDQFLSEEEIIFSGWNSRSRKESLEHYLPMGWSFGQEHLEGAQSNLIGYFLAQPLVFFEGQTQSLWVEHIQYNSLKVRDDLCEMAYR